MRTAELIDRVATEAGASKSAVNKTIERRPCTPSVQPAFRGRVAEEGACISADGLSCPDRVADISGRRAMPFRGDPAPRLRLKCDSRHSRYPESVV